jgi:hypothetical protein
LIVELWGSDSPEGVPEELKRDSWTRSYTPYIKRAASSSENWPVIGELLNLAQFLPRLKDVVKTIRFIPLL